MQLYSLFSNQIPFSSRLSQFCCVAKWNVEIIMKQVFRTSLKSPRDNLHHPAVSSCQRTSSLPPPMPRKNRFLPEDSYTGHADVENEIFSIRLQGLMSITTAAFTQKASSEAWVFHLKRLRAVSPGTLSPGWAAEPQPRDPSEQRPPLWRGAWSQSNYISTWLILTMADLETHRPARLVICHQTKCQWLTGRAPLTQQINSL